MASDDDTASVFSGRRTATKGGGNYEFQSAPAFRTYAVDSPYAAQTLRKRLLDRKAELAVPVVSGHVQGWDDYCKRTGVIEGLTEAIAICEDMTKQQERQ